jgi:tRNA G18 (ribose-2'-O)-methylase SpoU
MPKATWCCDDVTEGTLHNGVGDARVNGLAGSTQTDEETDSCIAQLEAARRRGREQSREAAAAEASAAASPSPANDEQMPLSALFDPLSAFTLRNANDGGDELKLYDAMTSPDRQLIKAGYFVAEGALVVQQLLRLPEYRLASILSTEAQLRKLAPDLRGAEAAYCQAAAAASGEGAAAEPPCLVFAGSRANVSSATGFKHSALSILAIARRPPTPHLPLARWLPALRPAAGTVRPSLLVLDAVVKPENVGSLFRTALAFGVAGVVLSPGCSDPLYRKAVRASMGGCFKLPCVHAPKWPEELRELKASGYRLLALHLEGSTGHASAIAPPADGAPSPPLAIVVGAEYEGVGSEAAAICDARVRIPMSGAMDATLDSLNVNVAAAIVLERVFTLSRDPDAPDA